MRDLDDVLTALRRTVVAHPGVAAELADAVRRLVMVQGSIAEVSDIVTELLPRATDPRVRVPLLQVAAHRAMSWPTKESCVRAAGFLAEAERLGGPSALLAILRGGVAVHLGQLDAALGHSRRAVALARDTPSPVMILRTSLMAARLHHWAGRLDEARTHLETGLEAAGGAKLDVVKTRAWAEMTMIHLAASRVGSARAAAEEAEVCAERSGSPSARLCALNALGHVELDALQPVAARAAFERAREMAEEMGLGDAAVGTVALLRQHLPGLNGGIATSDLAVIRDAVARGPAASLALTSGNALWHALHGAAAAQCGRVGEAEAAMRRAHACMTGPLAERSRAWVEALEGQVDLARARAIVASGGDPSKQVAAVRARMAPQDYVPPAPFAVACLASGLDALALTC